MAKTHVIDGVTYVEVDRQAEVGEKVIITNDECYRQHNGMVGVAEYVYNTGISVNVGNLPHYFPYIDDGNYRVLAEVEEPTVDGTQASEQVIDMLANLARRVTQLESQLLSAQNNLEKQSYELENAKHRISKHAAMFGAVEEKVVTLMEDVITLDERSQILSAINKYYAEVR